MKLNRFSKAVLFGTLSSVFVMLVALVQIPTAHSSELPTIGQPVQILAAKSGNFVAAEAPTTGSARIVEEGRQRYLEIDEAFSTTDQAPDLQVLLDVSSIPPQTYERFGSYINLGGLQSVSGAQRYPIPNVIALPQYRSVVIWCRTANATMGYASLS
ncbi:MAG: DM13 domain-containing protein [Cyanobacteria bacterium P01_A01_bin.114]